MSVFTQPNPSLNSSNDSEVVDYSNEPQPEFGDPDHSFYYEQAMKGDVTSTQRDKPENGYYRTRDFTPVGIWLEKGKTLIKIGSCDPVPFSLHQHEPAWMSARRNPVAKCHWLNFIYSGIPWPDLPEIHLLSNEPEDRYESLVARVDGKIEFVRDWVRKHPKITTKVDADFAANLSGEIRDLIAEADREHKTEKQPHLDACRATDDRYRFRETCDKARKALKALTDGFLAAETLRQRQEAEAERKRLQAIADAEAAAERAAAKAEGRKPEPDPEPVIIAMPEVNKTLIGGSKGPRTSLQINYDDVTILDWDAAFSYMKDRDPKLKAELLRSVKAEAKRFKAETDIPGTIIKDNLGEVICDYTPKPQTKPATKKKAKTA